MGHLPIQHGTSIYTVWDTRMGHRLSHYSMGHIYIQYGTYIHTVWDIYTFSMGHISIQYGTWSVWDIYLGYAVQHGTYMYAVWHMGHISKLYFISWWLVIMMLFIGDWWLGCLFPGDWWLAILFLGDWWLENLFLGDGYFGVVFPGRVIGNRQHSQIKSNQMFYWHTWFTSF